MVADAHVCTFPTSSTRLTPAVRQASLIPARRQEISSLAAVESQKPPRYVQLSMTSEFTVAATRYDVAQASTLLTMLEIRRVAALAIEHTGRHSPMLPIRFATLGKLAHAAKEGLRE